jgi:asparagine synthase (glutamine-hydrolysing)
LALVMDGRVDNWEELRKELLGRGVVLRNRSDAELVLRAYEVWGKECLKFIDGDFALVIWDTRKKIAFCARDRMGNKPFQYHWNGSTLVFASELHPILALPWVAEEPNEGILAEFLSNEWYSRDETFWNGIRRLVAAHRMDVDSRGPFPEQYWSPDLWAALPYTTDQEYIEHYRELFFDTVRRLSRSHKPVAYEVSGGLDSSAVFCVAEHLRRTQRLPAPGIEAYTLTFTDDDEANELPYAQAIGKELGVKINEIKPSLMPLSWYSKRAQMLKDFPGYPTGIMLKAINQRVSSNDGVVIITGTYGDHWLQGSRAYYAEELAQHQWHNLMNCFKGDVKDYGVLQSTYWFLRYGIYPFFPVKLRSALRLLKSKTFGKPSPDASWLSPHLQEILAHRRAIPQPDHGRRFRTKVQSGQLKTLYYAFDHHGSEIGERLGAESGVEKRHPLRDPRFVQFAFSTPERLRMRGNIDKFIHVQSMNGILPKEILERRDKAQFEGVFLKYLDQMADVFMDELPVKRSKWCDRQAIQDMFNLYQQRPDLGWQSWVLWSFYGCDKTLP